MKTPLTTSRILQSPFAAHLGLLIICLITYWPTLFSGFMIDDFGHISSGEPSYKILNFFKSSDQHYNPLYHLLNKTLFLLTVNNPLLLHAFSLFLFYTNCLFIFLFLSRITGDRRLGFYTALFFCLHPLNAEIMNHISLNITLVCCSFMLLSLENFMIYIEQRRRLFWITSMIFFILSLLSLEIAILLPLYLGIILFILKKQPLKSTLQNCLPFLGIAILYLILWSFMTESNINSLTEIWQLTHLTLDKYVFTLMRLWSWYIQKFFIPVDIVWIYNIWPVAPDARTLVFLGAKIFVLFALIVFSLSKRNGLSFAFLWFMIGFPLSLRGAITHLEAGLVFEPYWMYFSSIGAFLLLAIILTKIAKSVRPFLFYIFLGALCLFFFIHTQRINSVMKTEKSYCEYWLNITINPLPLSALGKISAEEGLYDQSVAYYEQYLGWFVRSPYSPIPITDLYVSLASILAEAGKPEQAKEYINMALTHSPRFALAYNTLATIYVREQNFSAAEENFKKAIQLNDSVLPALNLADLYLMEERYAEAETLFEGLLHKDVPRHERKQILQKLLTICLKTQQWDKIAEYLNAFMQNMESGQDAVYISKMFENAPDISIQILKQAEKIYPHDKEVLLYYGVLLANNGELPKAIKMWEKGKALYPHDKRFSDNLQQAKTLLKQKPASLR